jgi:hypothetical protein
MRGRLWPAACHRELLPVLTRPPFSAEIVIPGEIFSGELILLSGWPVKHA